MDTERQVAQHYNREGLEQAILAALAASGKNIDRLEPGDLSGVDEFHLGWHAQTVEFAQRLGLAPGQEVLDIGSGIGGPARYFAHVHGCRVTGIDLTPEFVATATGLTRRCGLDDRVRFSEGSALDLPAGAARFDVATLIHVGMNIADKAKLFAEARRVLKPGGRFGVYDIMLAKARAADIPYPVPWAASSETSFVEPPATYRRLLEAAGFAIEAERDRSAFALALGREMREKAATHGAPPLGLHVIMGPAAPERLRNVMASLEGGLIAPTEIVARAV